MKQWLKFMFVIILIIPFIVSAEEVEDNYVKVAETVKYFKTTSIFNNSSVMRDTDFAEMSSITVEVSEEEFNNAPTETEPVAPINGSRTYTQTETTYKRLTTTIETNATYYRYTTNLYWRNIPRVRSYDIIAIGHYNDVELYNSQNIVFTQDYCENAYSCYYSSTGTDVVKEYGTAVVFHLPNDSLISLEQTLTFVVKKAVSWTIDEQVAAGDYAHATSNTIASLAANNLRIGVGGLILPDVIYDIYDTTPAAIADWSGTW